MQWQWILGPAVGAMIGYITNDVAVRMLFRPYTEKHILGWRVPFTPGIIPKGRRRLSRAIRDVIAQDLLSAEVLEAALLSPQMLSQVDALADGALQAILVEERTPRVLLEGLFGREPFDGFEAQAKRAAGLFLMEKLLQSGVERTIAGVVVGEVRTRVSHSTAGLSKLIWDDRRSASMEETLTQSIREMLATHGPGLVDGMIESAVSDGLDTPISALVARYGDRMDAVRAFLVAQYQNAIRSSLAGALRTLDLGAVIEERINSLEMADLEALIMQVMKKELRTIVWLGALLGAVIGMLNAVIPL